MIVHDADGNELGELSISDKQREALSDGAAVEVQYHTPQLLQSVLGTHSGTFTLQMDDDRLVTTTPDIFKRYLELRDGVARRAN